MSGGVQGHGYHSTGWIDLHLPSMFVCGAEINGQSVREVSDRGTSTQVVHLPVSPGRHTLTVWYRYRMAEYGRRELVVDVHPSSRVSVFYTPPIHILAPARLDFAPHRRSWGLDAREVFEVAAALAVTVAVLVLGYLVWTWIFA